MRHVLVETNWVVEVLMPKHRGASAATDLLDKAASGHLALHVPAFCLREAKLAVQRKFGPRSDARAVRRFLKWAAQQQRLEPTQIDEIDRVVDAFSSMVEREVDTSALDQRVQTLSSAPGLEVFALDESMLDRALQLGATGPTLKPLDEAVLAAVLVRAEQLRRAGVTDIRFCELDSDLLPRSKRGQRKEPLASYYDQAGIVVVDDFVSS